MDDDEEFACCDGTGHAEGCEAREPAHDIGDLIARTPCLGCCPNGHKPDGLQALQDATAARARALLAPARPRDLSLLMADCVHCDRAFPTTQLQWHARRCKTAKESRILRCRYCGCMTPIIFLARLEDA